jgi:GntR family histidine utilization transcriptional repressor
MINLPDNASPLYEKVKNYVLQNIGSGQWGQDQRLPSENELVSALGVSRMTIHRALRELTSVGVLVRIQGVGTFVAASQTKSDLLEINNIAAEIEGRGHRHHAEVILLETLMTPPALTTAFEFKKRRLVYHSIVVHFENEEPVQVEERFVNPDLAPDYDQQDFNSQTTFEYLQRQTPVTEIEHVISAIAADKTIADHLRLTPSEPCLLLQRRTWTGDAVVTVNRFTYAGSRYSLGSRYWPSRRK